MAASTQPESTSPSRRALLAGALGGLGALAASAIGRSGSVRAANGGSLIIGAWNTGTFGTTLEDTTTSGGSGLSVLMPNATGSSDSLVGQNDSSVGAGVRGYATSFSGRSRGVEGQDLSPDGFGVLGFNNSTGTGVAGISGGGAPTNHPKTGIYGEAGQDSSSRGVWGRSSAGQGVRGQTSGGIGLYGQATSGYALVANGRVRVNKVSGVATIAAGDTSKTIAPGVNVTSGSFVLLTPKVKLSGRDLWFTTNATHNRFTIRMSSSRSSATKVAWLLLG
jgi:hypothetical protein